jgi:hypothetical protein
MRNVSDQVVEEIKTQILCSFLLRKWCRFWDNVGKYSTAKQTTDGIIIRLMRCFHWINKARKRQTLLTFSNCVYSTEKQLCERVSVVQYNQKFILFHLMLYLTLWITVTSLRSKPAVMVVCSSEILSFYCYWLCSVDIAVGLLVWCLKDNRMNRLTVKVWQLLRGFCVSIVIGCVGLI